ncbi:hypothetical protein M5689_025242 [Euphorbia peplus]|nr:hypothetical protein M5689_025242 [Euphorbia peplus]
MRRQEVISRARPNHNEVIITVYVEKPRILSSSQTDLTRKALSSENLSKPPQISLTESFNRRAELLAYARELRQTHFMHEFKEGQPTKKASRRKKEEHEQLISKQNSETQQFENSRKKRAQKSKFPSNFCRKMKSLLKNVSCGLFGCNKRQ